MRRQAQAPLDRGRSRTVSPAAIARRAEEQRRKAAQVPLRRGLVVKQGEVTPPPALAPPTSPVTCQAAQRVPQLNISNSIPMLAGPSTIPSPTESNESEAVECITNNRVTLQDQIQAAYAADDMHLARILLLKSKGIEVTGDDDPRIAEVKDDDFCFVPEGALVLDEECLAVIREAQKKEEERRVAYAKEQRLRQKQRLWEEEARRMRMEKARARSLKADGRCQYTIDVPTRSARREVIAFKVPAVSPSSVLSDQDTRFLYTYMPPMASSLPSSSHTNDTLSRMNHRSRQKIQVLQNGVSFKDVVARMQGPLFPVDQSDITGGPRTQAQLDHLAALLKVVQWEDGERKRAKGKAKMAIDITPALSPLSSSPASNCRACSSYTVSSISRTNSWASAISDGSIVTEITTPATSPVSEKIPLPPLFEDLGLRTFVHSCRHRSKLEVVPLQSTPLYIPDSIEDSKIVHPEEMNEPIPRRTAMLRTVRKSLSSAFDIAVKMQLSYFRSVHISVASSVAASPKRSTTTSTVQSALRRLGSTFATPSNPLPLKPEGFRASKNTVALFIDTPSDLDDDDSILSAFQDIVLHDLSAASVDLHNYPPHIARNGFTIPSPLRPRYKPGCPQWRLRPIANPVVLRLRAVQNIIVERGLRWEGRAPPGSLGCGQEKLTGVAFDGLCGSKLAREAVVLGC